MARGVTALLLFVVLAAAIAGEGSGAPRTLRRRALDERDRLAEAALDLERRGLMELASRSVEAMLPLERQLSGEASIPYIAACEKLAALRRAVSDYPSAIANQEKAADGSATLLGPDHPETIRRRDTLPDLRSESEDPARKWPQMLRVKKLDADAGKAARAGLYSAAAPLAERALAIRKARLGPAHPDTIATMSNVAVLYFRLGGAARAEPLLREVVERAGEAFGEAHPLFAEHLSHLAWILQQMGDYERSEPLCRRALSILREAVGPDHHLVANASVVLARLLHEIGRAEEGEPLLRDALRIYALTPDRKQGDAALIKGDLGKFLLSLGRLDEAEPLLREAVEDLRRCNGEGHHTVASALIDLAELHYLRREFDRAESLFHQAAEIRRKARGEEEAVGRYSNNLAHLYWAMGEPERAEPLLRRAIEHTWEEMDRAARIQSERQQIRMAQGSRHQLDLYLTLAGAGAVKAADAYRHVLRWKGRVFARQAYSRAAAANEDLRPLLDELTEATRRLSTLSLSRGEGAPGVAELSERVERLEAEVAAHDPGFQRQVDALRVSPGELCEALPPETVLIDYFEYVRTSFVEEAPGAGEVKTNDFVAFVLRPGEEVERIDLGAAAPIAAAVDRWRESIGSGEAGRAAGRELRRLVWEPIAGRLAKAGTVLVSPDGALARVAFGALPGASGSSYLLEESPIAVVPVPQLLPGLLASPATAPPDPSLLLVGAVEYGAPPGLPRDEIAARDAPRSGGLASFRDLPGSGGEARAIRELFAKRFPAGCTTSLEAGEATEAAFRREAPRHRWLHLATHGFFAPPELTSALAPPRDPESALGRAGLRELHPGLLSGLALAGANRGPEPGGDDGILTAIEVATLDLGHVELAVLSACETGLGATAGGEGVLGLQRAFHSAGARTTVTSLWAVPDRATRLLMERFYENLWKRSLPALEALREAQLHLLGEVRPGTDLWRGLGLSRDASEDAGGRLPPRYWAAFVLAGDWR